MQRDAEEYAPDRSSPSSKIAKLKIFSSPPLDVLKGFSGAIEVVFPEVQTPLSIAQPVRGSLFYVSHIDRKEAASGLRSIHQAAALVQADREVSNFAEQ